MAELLLADDCSRREEILGFMCNRTIEIGDLERIRGASGEHVLSLGIR